MDRGQECMIEVEDDGAGEDPEKVRRALAGDHAIDSVGLGNVDARLRRRSATTTGWWWRPRAARVPR